MKFEDPESIYIEYISTKSKKKISKFYLDSINSDDKKKVVTGKVLYLVIFDLNSDKVKLSNFISTIIIDIKYLENSFKAIFFKRLSIINSISSYISPKTQICIKLSEFYINKIDDKDTDIYKLLKFNNLIDLFVSNYNLSTNAENNRNLINIFTHIKKNKIKLNLKHTLKFEFYNLIFNFEMDSRIKLFNKIDEMYFKINHHNLRILEPEILLICCSLFFEHKNIMNRLTNIYKQNKKSILIEENSISRLIKLILSNEDLSIISFNKKLDSFFKLNLPFNYKIYDIFYFKAREINSPLSVRKLDDFIKIQHRKYLFELNDCENWYNSIMKTDNELNFDNNLVIELSKIEFKKNIEKSLLEFNFDNVFSLEELAKNMNLSKRTLHRKFILHFQETPYKYFLNFKFRKAKELILQGKQMKDIAYTLGFNTPSQFTNQFKKEFGISPKEYKLSIK